MATPNPNIPEIPSTPDLAAPLTAGAAAPLLLFPVRLETRFFPAADASTYELRLRVFPDKVHIDAHEPGLTADETEWGTHFWVETWRAGNDEARRKAAWVQLADRFEATRAAWIATTLQPLNPADRPADPVADDQTLSKAPQFPSPATKADAWTRAPWTTMLPDAWIALGYAGGKLVFNAKGKAIPAVLATGPDPTAAAAPASDDSIPAVDDGMKWIVDFAAAEQVGMGIRVSLTQTVATAGLDYILVLGIRSGADSSTSLTARLAELFSAHHYTDGLSFIRQGTPSNNTADAPSGFDSTDPGHDASYQAEFATLPYQPGDLSNADVLSGALGLGATPSVFANIPGGTNREQLAARAMNTALWQGTLGYFLLQMLGVGIAGESPLSDDDIAWARSHFIGYVRAGGPLPGIRVGKQPYGILPASSLSAWKPQPGDDAAREQALTGLLLTLRTQWRTHYGDVPRLGASDDVAADLALVMSMDGVSSGYAMRHLIGRHAMEHLWVFLGANYFFTQMGLSWQPQPRIPITLQQFNDWITAQDTLAAAFPTALGITWRPRLAKAAFSNPVATLEGPWVQAAPGTALTPNYLSALLAARDLDSIRQNTAAPQPASLLYLLVRHSMLLEYAAAAAALLMGRGLLQTSQRREPELVDMPAGQSTSTIWRQMTTPIAVQGVAAPIQVGKYLLGSNASGDPDTANEPGLKPLRDFRDSLSHLAGLDASTLELAMAGTLDLSSHRLDAWITSLATKRLAQMQAANPSGILVGGYGWLMNVKPSPPQNPLTPPAGEDAPLFPAPDNPGFTHAPSLTQAATAAVLRSGYLGHAVSPAPNDLLAIDLSSARVRLAAWLLAGVRQGQPLGALLGYRFERRLQDAGKAQFIEYFREVAPLVARKMASDIPAGQPAEAIAANNVVDGLALQKLWATAAAAQPANALSQLFSSAASKPADADLAAAKTVLEAELNALADSVDAVSDALLAESVHQVVRGNPLRAATTVESIAGGEAPPPELDVVRTPRTGIALTHRLVALFSGEPVLASGWPQAGSARGAAEPHLNAWLGRLLPDPARVGCLVDRLDPSTGVVLETGEIRLSELGLAPLDFVYALQGGAGQQAEIEQRILYAAVRRTGGFAADALLRINTARKSGWTTADLGYGEFSELLRTARKLVGGTRGINDNDLNPPDRTTATSVDIAELEKRSAAAAQTLQDTVNGLGTQLTAPDSADAELLRGLLLGAAGLGVPGAVPLSAAGNLAADRQVLLAQAASVRAELAQRATQAAANAASTTTVDQRRDAATAVLRAVFGPDFVVLCRLSPANAAELGSAITDGAQSRMNDPFAVTTWFQRASRVRDGASRLDSALAYAEALKAGESLGLSVAQLPYASGERWVGLPLQKSAPIPGGKLSLVVQSAVTLDVHQPLAGALLDEWVEVVPSPVETTGITFQYDQPDSSPPQTILLAVPPEVGVPWSVWSLQQVLLETLDLARIRAVDPDALIDVGQYLPALYFASNAAGDTVTTDFSPLK